MNSVPSSVEIDLPRKRISLTMKSGEGHTRKPDKQAKGNKSRSGANKARDADQKSAKPQGKAMPKQEPALTALAEAFNRAKQK